MIWLRLLQARSHRVLSVGGTGDRTNYGVATDFSSGLVFSSRARDGAGIDAPLVVSGRALPLLSISHRPVFQLVELQSVRVNDVISLLGVAFKSSEALSIQPDNSRNAVLLMGRPELVRQALDAIKVFDQRMYVGVPSARLGAWRVCCRPDGMLPGVLGGVRQRREGPHRYSLCGRCRAGAGRCSDLYRSCPDQEVLSAAGHYPGVFVRPPLDTQHAIDWARINRQTQPHRRNRWPVPCYMVKNTRASGWSRPSPEFAVIHRVAKAVIAAISVAAKWGKSLHPPLPPPVRPRAVHRVVISAVAETGTLDEPRNAVFPRQRYRSGAADAP